MSYVPEWATHYKLEATSAYETTIHFCKIEGMIHSIAEWMPLSELATDLAIADVVQQIKDKPLSDRMQQHSKYHREILPSVWVDVYEVLGAFTADVSERAKAAVDHAIKKLLAPGQRGVKSERQDLVEARDSLNRAIQLLDDWA